jgi:hypothetical protein
LPREAPTPKQRALPAFSVHQDSLSFRPHAIEKAYLNRRLGKLGNIARAGWFDMDLAKNYFP